MTNKQIWDTALNQSALEFGCEPGDFLSGQPKVTISRSHSAARRYLPLPFACDMVSYGPNVVAQCSEAVAPIAYDYIRRYPAFHCFETPHLQALDDMLAPHGLKVCFMAEYFLPDVDAVKEQPCDFELRLLHKEDFSSLYLPQWSNALCKDRAELDVLGVGAFDGDTLVGFAGCSADCQDMWQIGVDVLPDYRRRGIAAAVTSRLALEVLKRGKVPFYCAAWCNIASVRNAIRCGFRPAWVEITARENAFVDKMNTV